MTRSTGDLSKPATKHATTTGTHSRCHHARVCIAYGTSVDPHRHSHADDTATMVPGMHIIQLTPVLQARSVSSHTVWPAALDGVTSSLHYRTTHICARHHLPWQRAAVGQGAFRLARRNIHIHPTIHVACSLAACSHVLPPPPTGPLPATGCHSLLQD